MKYIPQGSLGRGFASGIAITLLAAVGILAGVQATSAEGSGVWRDVSDSSNTRVWSERTASRTDSLPDSRPDSMDTAGRGAGLDTGTDPEVTDQSVSDGSYVALGDSVAAGLGLPLQTTSGTSGSTQDRRCGRSSQSYAYEVGRRIGRPTSLFACSGASSGDLFTRQWISNSNPNIQLQQAFAQGQPEIISITAGANDIAWNRLLQACYKTTCGSRAQNALVTAQLKLLQRNLFNALAQIKERSDRNGSQPPLVVLTGYYNPVSQSCTDALPDNRITANEISWITGGVDALNKTIEDMAGTYGTFARYAPVDFDGHDICSGDSWVQGLDGSAPIHPTAAGQQAIADSVVQAIESSDSGDSLPSAI